MRARPGGEDGTDRREGRRTGGGAEPHLLEGFGVFERGTFPRNSPGPPPGQLVGALPPPLLAEQVAGSSGFRRGPARQAAGAPPASAARPFPLAEKGKSARPGPAGGSGFVPTESRAPEGARLPPASSMNVARRRGRQRCSREVARAMGGRELRWLRGCWEPAGCRERQAPVSSSSPLQRGGWNF